MGRFTCDGSPALEARIAADCALVATRLRQTLPPGSFGCLVLGGGYGRGDGGVLRDAEGCERPHNDYDLVLIHHGPRGPVGAACLALGAELTPRLGVHVDVTPIPAQRIATLPAALTWFELGAGHAVIDGEAALIAPLAARTLADVAASEWGRLLTNRACGLVFSGWATSGLPCPPRRDEDPWRFAERQVRKAWLALGDALLASRGLYHPRVLERRTRWLAMPAQPSWSHEWLAAVAWKLHPHPAAGPAEILASRDAVAPLLAAALRDLRAASTRPWKAAALRVLRLPPRAWLHGAPWEHPRDSLRRACADDLSGQGAAAAVFGSPAAFTALWESCG